MLKICQNLLILVFMGTLLGCESKNTYDIGSDKVVEDLSLRIQSLSEDLTLLKDELAEVKKVLEHSDIDSELRKSIRREIHEGEKHAKDIDQWLALLKIRRKNRYRSLVDRKEQKDLKVVAEKEVKEYFLDKKLNPINKKWQNRYRTAIEL